jgi:hypothetical protein
LYTIGPWIIDDISRGEPIRCIEEELRLLESYASIIQLIEMMTSKEGIITFLVNITVIQANL